MGMSLRYTSSALEGPPNIDDVRYEIIAGDLHVSKPPRYHQSIRLRAWSRRTGLSVPVFAPGLVFAAGSHPRAAPKLVVAVLSPGSAHEKRDRDYKLKLYSRQGVDE